MRTTKLHRVVITGGEMPSSPKNMQWDNWFGMLLAMFVGTVGANYRSCIMAASFLAALSAVRELSYAIRSRHASSD